MSTYVMFFFVGSKETYNANENKKTPRFQKVKTFFESQF